MQLTESKEFRIYQKKLKNLLSKYKTIKDIILFGSIVKGDSYRDIDIALILENKEILREIKKDLKKIGNFDIEVLDSIYDMLWPVLMREGFSIKKGKFLYEIYKVKPVVLYKYSLKSLDNVKKVQFSRGLKNILKDVDAKILSRSLVLVPLVKKNNFEDFLDLWNLKYQSKSYELFPILRKEKLV